MNKIRVFIPFTNEKVFRSMFRKNRYQPEFKEWMLTTFGQVSGGFWGSEPHYARNGYTQSGMTFWFKEPMHAMTFKLTWV